MEQFAVKLATIQPHPLGPVRQAPYACLTIRQCSRHLMCVACAYTQEQQSDVLTSSFDGYMHFIGIRGFMDTLACYCWHPVNRKEKEG